MLNGGELHLSGGYAVSAFASPGGSIFVSGGGVVNRAKVHGLADVKSGGELNSTTALDGGLVTVRSKGYAYAPVVSSGGTMAVFSGGSVNFASVCAGGSVALSGGVCGNDVIAGGIGDDAMHGGGGDDIFVFCENWGLDLVKQRSSGSVTLWFASGDESNWNAETLTYADGENKVAVSGVSADRIALKFGDDGSDLYAGLFAMGAFDAFSSRRIFDEAGNAALARL